MNNSEASLATLKRPSVIILSDDAEFVRAVVSRWQTDRIAPEISVVAGDSWHASMALAHDLIVIGPLHLNEDLSIPVALRDAAGKPVVCITAQQSKLRQLVTGHVNFLVIEQREDWVTNLIVLGNEILRRVEALGRAHRAERSASESQRYASLGRYMLDMRPGVNDALTSILGNADLLLLEPTQDPQNIREQITTIHCMSLRLNEIMQRFSSLASEMQSHKAQPASR